MGMPMMSPMTAPITSPKKQPMSGKVPYLVQARLNVFRELFPKVWIDLQQARNVG